MFKECPAHGFHTGDTCPICVSQPVPITKKGTEVRQAPLITSRFLMSQAQYLSIFKASKVEYQRFQYLFACEQNSIISKLQLQPEFELRPRIVVKKNGIHNGYTQSREIYTADFQYIYAGKTIIEDVKGGKIKGKKRLLKPYVKTAARNKHKALIHLLHLQNRLQDTSLLMTVWYGKQWHYFDSNHNTISFSLEATQEAA